MGKIDWDIVTAYSDVVTTTLKTVTFPKVQEKVYLRNQGNANITYAIGAQSGTLTPGQSVTVVQDVSSFTVQAVSGTHTFELRANEKGTEINETETKLSDVANTSRFGYNLNDGLFNFRVALSNVQNQIVRINCIGDSITRGEYTSNESTKPWAGQLRSLLQTQYGGSGEGFINPYEASLPAQTNPRWSFGSGWVSVSGPGGFGGYWSDSGSSTNVNPATVTFNGASVSVMYITTTDGGTADVKVDGVSKATLNCLGSVDFSKAPLNITGLSAGAHTLTITPTGNGKIFIDGILEGGGATNGIQVNKIGRSGWKASDWITDTNRFSRWSSLSPSLTIIALGMNESNKSNPVPVETYKNNLATLIQKFQSFGSSILLVPYFAPNTGWTDRWVDYVNANYELAKQYNCGLVDMYQAWGKSWTIAQTQGLFGLATNNYSGGSGDNWAHPGDKGHNFIAQIIKQHLMV
jgi:hypothetical protein